jgi:two-component system NtrC family sensor kinase
VLIDDVREDGRWSAQDDRHLGRYTRSLMAVPLMTSERTIGVIIVTNLQTAMYTRDELSTLQTLASTLSVALENARLYDDLKRLLREREQAQERLIRTEKMAALGRLVASITHEINNPLQAMQMYLTLAEENLEGREGAENLLRYITIVGSEVERISTIVHRLRDFYRPSQVEVRRVAVHDVLDSVLELTHKQLQHSAVTVERRWASDLPRIDANPDRLKQVFLNLVLNAVDAMPEGGILSLSTARDVISGGEAQPDQPAVRIEFSDTGKGIPPEILSRIFEPFFTVKEQGVGLGLSVSYAIVRAHGGQISVDSHVGLGTVFTILLPTRQSGTIVVDTVGSAAGRLFGEDEIAP